MKTRIKFVATALIASLFFTAAWAGSGNGNGGDFDVRKGPPSAEDKLARMSDALHLTADQAMAMLEVLLAAEERRAAAHEEVRALIEPQVCADRLATEEEILSILTPEQVALLEQHKEQRADRSKNRKGRHGPSFDCSAYEADS